MNGKIPPTLLGDQDIVELHKRGSAMVWEDDLKGVLKRYNLRNGLIALGRASSYIVQSNDSKNKIGKAALMIPDAQVIISQFALSYMANLLIISGSNDYKAKLLNPPRSANILILCNTYSNCLVQPEIMPDYGKMDEAGVRSMMIRMYFEQILNYQFTVVPLMARSIYLFDKLSPSIKPDKFEPLSTIFERETGISIYDYFRIAMAIWAGAQKTATFSIKMLTEAKITQMKDVLIEEKVKAFISIISSNYTKFRDLDNKMNAGLNPVLTKTRFNPLLVAPAIETDEKNMGDHYVIPNFTCYAKKVFGGIYWWFHTYFENRKQTQDFRNYFGHVFEEYVGTILKGVFGEEKVHPQITYADNKRFIDWWVEYNDKIYLFEAKANQFALPILQTGDQEKLMASEIKKVVDAIEQVFNRVSDIPKYPELKQFSGKKLIPVIVFLDMPFISQNMYDPLIKDALMSLEKEKNLKGLSDFACNLMNIEELEFFDDVVGKIELEDIFSQLKSNINESFISIISKVKGKPLLNKFLDGIYMSLWADLGDPQYQPKDVDPEDLIGA